MTNPNTDEQLRGLDQKKRDTLKRLGLGAAFVVPVVASFSLEALTISKVHAASPNGSEVREEKQVKKCKPQSKGESCNPECGAEACEPDLVCLPLKGGGTRCDID